MPADMTRLTLDTIALCGFGYRFNSFYRDTPHPFVEAMVRTLDESQARLAAVADPDEAEDPGTAAGRRGPGVHRTSLVDDLIAKRRAKGDAGDNTDLLGRMLTGVDKQTGERLADDEHPRPVHHVPHRRPRDDQRPAVVRDLLPAEASGGAGAGPRGGRPGARRHDAQPTFDQIHQLHLRPPGARRDAAPVADGAGVQPPADEDTVIGGRYAIPRAPPIMVLHADAAP